MYNGLKGYNHVSKKTIDPDKYYVMCLKNLRKPYLLRFSCDTSLLAKKYIINYPSQWIHDIIKGDKALMRGIPLYEKLIPKANSPCKYIYPPNMRMARKTFRGNTRSRLERAEKNIKRIKQYTIKFRGITYTTFAYSYTAAYLELNRHVPLLRWGHFMKRVDTNPQRINKKTIFIKSYTTSYTTIQMFNKLHGINQIRQPNIGLKSINDDRFFLIKKPKPKSLNLV